MRNIQFIVTLIATTVCLACGGSGGGDGASGTVIQGTLTERGTGHKAAILNGVTLKHSSGEALEDVKVCIANTCSLTDGQGQWGLNIDNFTGGAVEVAVIGHGIDSQTTVDLPSTAKEVELALGHNSGAITIEKLVIDGEDHTGHDHSH